MAELVGCLLCLLPLMFGFAEARAPLMTTPGHADVDNVGQFTYSIPIQVPPGTAGMAPTLSLNYASRGPDGYEGIGWSLGGLPSITRCAQTVAQDGDGHHGGVNYQSSDRFCLDGQRLLLVNGGHSYGDDGSEYRTEIESFTKIVAYGSQGDGAGPTYFVVYTKSGLILELGNTPDSRILPLSTSGGTMSAVRVWAVDEISDLAGNYLKVAYTNSDTTTGEYYPLSIVYTANDGAGLGPHNSVFFHYSGRVDVANVYQAGAKVTTTMLLTDIKTYLNTSGAGTPVSDYKLTYENGSTTTHSRLKTVQRCAGSGTCLAATTFTWQGGTTPSMSTTTMSLDSGTFDSGTYLPALGDFNGDGLIDVLVNQDIPCPTNGEIDFGQQGAGVFVSGNMTAQYDYFPNQGDAWSNPHHYSGTACFLDATNYLITPNAPIAVDIDGDGFSDVVVDTTYWRYLERGNLWDLFSSTSVLQNNKSGKLTQASADDSLYYPFFLETGSYSGYGHYGYQYWYTSVPGDYNGDGRSDGFFFGSTAYAYLSNGDGTFKQDNGHPGPGSGKGLAADFDGDGCSDVLDVTAQILDYLCQPAVLQIATSLDWVNDTLTLGDFNGDGKTDVLAIDPTTGAGGVWLSTGTGFEKTDFSVPAGWRAYNIVAGDWNGDGKTDIALIAQASGTNDNYFKVSTGTGFAALVSGFGVSGPAYAGIPADWNNDGGAGVSLWPTEMVYYFAHTPEAIQVVDNGIGGKINVSYDRLNQNGSFYAKGKDAWPVLDIDGPIYVVKEIDIGNGIGGYFTTTYTYSGARADLNGRGFLGFSQIVTTDAQTHVVTTTTYNQTFPYIGTVHEQKKAVGTIVLSDSINTYGSTTAGTGQAFVYLNNSVVSGHEVDNTALPTTTTSYMNTDGSSSYDNYGNPQQITVSLSDGSYTRTTTNSYCNLASSCDDSPSTKWIIGRLTTTSVTTVISGSTVTRATSFQYQNTTGIRNGTIIEPTATTCNSSTSPTACKLETDYTTIDPYGHPTAATVSGVGFASRSTSVGYDSNGEFETSAINAKSQTEHWTYSDTSDNYPQAFGVPATHTDVNGQTTSWTYDSLGHMRLESRPGTNGTVTDIQYFYCAGFNSGSAACPANASFVLQVTPEKKSDGSTNGPVTNTYYDSLSRVIRVDIEGYDYGSPACGNPCWIHNDVNYDAYGNVSQTSRPYFAKTGTAEWIVNDHTVTATGYPSGYQDPYGRPWKVTYPDSYETNYETYAYAGLASHGGTQITFVDGRGKSTITKKNPQGLVSSVTNALGKTTSYGYDAVGNLLRVTDPTNSNAITNTYDIRGNKLTSSDPDMGAWSYRYDALGELLGQTDAKGQSSSLSYDPLGRVTEEDEPDVTSTWTYDTATHGVGELAQATAASGGTPYYLRTPTYGSDGRPVSTRLTINGTDYTYNYSWGSDDRISTIQYPSGYTLYDEPTSDTADLAQIYDYAGGAPTQLRWTANARDAERRITEETAGNNVTTVRNFDPEGDWISQIRVGVGGDNSIRQLDYRFDAVGNLTSRTDSIGAYTENACYDDVNRLQYYAVGTSGGTSCRTGTTGLVKSIAYDNNTGNVTSKSDLATGGGTGTYTYPAAGSAQPHAVSSITGTVNGAVNPNFSYDANGNMVCEYTGSNCIGAGAGVVRETDTWMSFNMVKKINEGTTSATFTYDSEHSRIVQHMVNGSTIADTTYLFDPVSGAMSEMVASGGGTTWHDYLKADGRLVAERSCVGATPCSSGETWMYFARDHLDSVSVITDASGGVVAGGQLSFDAWGRQRNVDGSDDTACALPASEPTTRGYTAQETMPSYCLVNLNARVYDPTIGRLMSPDFIVPDPFNGEAFNRYSYVDNRPLSATDPSGHYCEESIRGIWVLCPAGCADAYCSAHSGQDYLNFASGGTSPGAGGGGGGGGTGSLSGLWSDMDIGTGYSEFMSYGTTSYDDLSGPIENIVVNCNCYWTFGNGGMDNYNSLDNLSQWSHTIWDIHTVGASIGFSYKFFGFQAAGALGYVYDDKGHASYFIETPKPGGYVTNSKGNMTGFNATINILESNAQTTTDLSGPFANQHFGVAGDLAVDMTTFEGTNSQGSIVSGSQLSFGIGEGVNFGTSVTNTTVFGTVTLPDSFYDNPASWEAWGE